MQADTASILRVLAHELRSPAGVAQGYLKMVLDGRLSEPADRQHGLEQARDAMGRIGALSREASDVAAWLERPQTPTADWPTVGVATLLGGMLARVDATRLDPVLDEVGATAVVRTCDDAVLSMALASLTSATIREAPQSRLTVRATLAGAPERYLDLVVATPEMLPAVANGPLAADAVDLPLERGGLGLSLIMALLVLDSHGARVWTVGNQRATLGVRLSVEQGSAS